MYTMLHSESAREDKEQVLSEVSRNGTLLYLAAPHLQADKDVVLAALRQNGWAIRFAARGLRQDEEVWITAMQQTSMSQRSFGIQMPVTWFSEQCLVQAMAISAMEFQHASAELRSNKQLVLRLMESNPRLFKYVHPTLRGDQDVLMVVLKGRPGSFHGVCNESSIPWIVRANKQLVLAAVASYGADLRYASKV